MSDIEITGQSFRFEVDTELTFIPHDVDGFHVAAPQFARALGFREAYDLLRSIPDSEKGSELVRTPGGEQQMGYLTEAGFYRALGQRQAARIADAELRERVERFQSWIYGTVLPQIRKTGSYGIASQVPKTLPEALRAYAREVEARQAIEAYARELEPKAEYVDDFVSPDDCLTFRTLANQIDMKETALRELLVEKKRIYRQFIGRRFSKKAGKLVDEYEWRAYADWKHHFRLFPQHNAPRHHNNQVRQTLYVTPPGAQAIRKIVGVLV